MSKKKKIPEVKCSDPVEEIARGEAGTVYENSGYLALLDVHGNAHIARFGHCSCYGTWTSICNGGVNDPGGDTMIFEWSGTRRQLVSLARRNADPAMPEREINHKDYDANYLLDMYKQVLAWHKGGMKPNRAKKAKVA